jgi:hypothetical protein
MDGDRWKAPSYLNESGEQTSGSDELFQKLMNDVSSGGQGVQRDTGTQPAERQPSETRLPVSPVDGEMTASEYANMPIRQVLGRAVTNIPSSGINVAKQLGNAVYNYDDTLSAMGDVGKGLISKAAGMVGVDQDPAKKAETERAVNAIGDMYTKRYTNYGEFAKTLAEDPFAIGMDVATVVPGIGLVSKAPLAGKIANVAKLGDPLALATKVISAAPRVAAGALKYPAAIASGSPASALKVAEEVGRTGGPEARQAFMRGASKDTPINTVSDMGSDMMKELKDNAQSSYLRDKASLTTDELPMNDIYGSLAKVEQSLQSQGLFPQFRAVLAEMKNQIDDVATSPNPAHRSAVGLDALKQSLNDTIDSSRLGGKVGAAGEIAKSVRDTIAKADPVYADMMERYQQWIKHFKDLKGIGFNENLSETARIQKLLTLLKKEDRLDLLQKLSTQTSAGKDLIPMLAGMAFREVAPPAYQGFGLAGLGMLAAQGPHGIGAAALGSPKLAGLSQYALGRASGAVPQVNSAIPNALVALEEQRMGRKSGGRVDSHDVEADHLVRAAERAKKGLSAHTEGLLNTSDESVVSALEVANRSI